jgi:hypothetical protein
MQFKMHAEDVKLKLAAVNKTPVNIAPKTLVATNVTAKSITEKSALPSTPNKNSVI